MTAHGVLIANKARGMTSHDVVADARRLFSTRVVGHAGTLDPMATGVLVLLFGEATKLASFATVAEKEYRAVVTFGRATDTLDAEGTTVSELSLDENWIDETRLASAIRLEHERVLQQPPVFSAISVGGQRAHRRARRGEAVTLEPRRVRASRIELLERSGRSLHFLLRVSKGYYVRAFARDLGSSLGVPAHLSELVRTASGPFVEERAVAWPPADHPPLMSVATAARLVLPAATLAPSGIRRAEVGQQLTAEDFVLAPTAESPSAWFTEDGRVVAIGYGEPGGTFRVRRGFGDCT